ncbi:hypothetical protein DBR06_SOUSAS1510065, partial [Sousa chinensis]
ARLGGAAGGGRKRRTPAPDAATFFTPDWFKCSWEWDGGGGGVEDKASAFRELKVVLWRQDTANNSAATSPLILVQV